MRGVVLCGGFGTRLHPLTLCQNKHLLPIYDKPMCFYPIQTLVTAGIKEVMLVVSGPFAGNFIHVLKNGTELGLRTLSYAYQEKTNGGIADALALAKDFAAGEPLAVILGDNTTDANIRKETNKYLQDLDAAQGAPLAKVFLKHVPDPRRFGIAEMVNDRITHITEKPQNPISSLAVTGLYLYDHHVFDFIAQCSPSKRGELEITDVNNFYIENGFLSWSMLDGFWQDAGTIENLYNANEYWASLPKQAR